MASPVSEESTVEASHPDIRTAKAEKYRFSNQPVIITVGSDPDKEQFLLHREIALTSSKYLQREAEKAIGILLQSEEVILFNIYAHWLYYGTLATKKDLNKDSCGKDISAPDNTEYTLLAEAYFLGERLEDEHFKDCIMDAFLAKMRSQQQPYTNGALNLPNAGCVSVIYKRSTPGHPLRRLLVKLWGRKQNSKTFKRLRRVLVWDFVVDLAEHLLEHRPQDTTGADYARNCDFHSHPKEESCTMVAGSRKRKRVGE